MNNKLMDQQLNIDTCGNIKHHIDKHHHPYEPTDYDVLELLVQTNLIKQEDTVLDYGCGKGRVGFYLNHKIGCKVIGIEFDREIYLKATLNLFQYQNDDIVFKCIDASDYKLDSSINHIYFFNPFSIQILHKVMNQIIDSCYENIREMYLYFYYPNEDYYYYLSSSPYLELYKTIKTEMIYHNKDQRELILIYKIKS